MPGICRSVIRRTSKALKSECMDFLSALLRCQNREPESRPETAPKRLFVQSPRTSMKNA